MRRYNRETTIDLVDIQIGGESTLPSHTSALQVKPHSSSQSEAAIHRAQSRGKVDPGSPGISEYYGWTILPHGGVVFVYLLICIAT